MPSDQTADSLSLSVRAALRRDESFSFFDLNLEPGIRQALQDLRVDIDDSYDNYGQAALLPADLTRFLAGLGNEPPHAAAAAAVIAGMANGICRGFAAEAAWVTVRASTPNHAFDIPRWHRDGYFFDPSGEMQRKVAVGLKGAPTLLKDLPDGLRRAFNDHVAARWEDTDENRAARAALLDALPLVTAPDGQGVVFAVGERGAIHSEPPIHADRLFLSVVPGGAAQIEELRVRWKAFPTSYSPAPKI